MEIIVFTCTVRLHLWTQVFMPKEIDLERLNDVLAGKCREFLERYLHLTLHLGLITSL